MGTSKKQKKRECLRYRDFVLSPYGVIKIKSLGYIRREVCEIIEVYRLLFLIDMLTDGINRRFCCVNETPDEFS
ncbi:hypothetical protein [Symbiopectobacterium sp. RP]|uniref:hypothetical protein n=1 Tax=Symbiopectobacterium sp. RP TaxID=3248553 RepID=UPI003D2B7F16